MEEIKFDIESNCYVDVRAFNKILLQVMGMEDNIILYQNDLKEMVERYFESNIDLQDYEYRHKWDISNKVLKFVVLNSNLTGLQGCFHNYFLWRWSWDKTMACPICGKHTYNLVCDEIQEVEKCIFCGSYHVKEK